MHLDRAHPFRYVLRYALYRPSPQIGGELRPRVGGDVDAAAERASHVGPDFLRRVYLHRAGDEDARLPVAVVHLQFHRDDASPVFLRGDIPIYKLFINNSINSYKSLSLQCFIQHN